MLNYMIQGSIKSGSVLNINERRNGLMLNYFVQVVTFFTMSWVLLQVID